MKNKKVLFIIKYPPPYNGASIINKLINKSNVINNSFICEYVKTKYSVSNKELGEFRLKKIFLFTKYFITIIYQCVIFRPDIIYFHISSVGMSFVRDSIIALFCKLFQVPIIFQFHAKGVRNSENKIFLSILYKWTFKNMYAIHLSKSLIYDIEPYFSPGKIFINSNGLPDQINIKRRNSKELFTFIFLSNIVLTKGILEVLKAAVILKEKGYGFVINIVGNETGISFKDIKYYINKYNISEFVNILGPLYGEDKFIELKSSDVLLFPTYRESFPLVIIEAYMAGLPVITTREGAIPDFFKNNENGFFVYKKNSNDLSEKMMKMINDKKLFKEFRKNNRDYYEKYLNFECYEDRFINIVNKIIKNENIN